MVLENKIKHFIKDLILELVYEEMVAMATQEQRMKLTTKTNSFLII